MRVALLLAGLGLGAAAIGAGWSVSRDTRTDDADAIIVVPGSPPLPERMVLARPADPAMAPLPARATPAQAAARSSTWWRPTVTDTWQWQLSGRIRTDIDADIYDIDLFDTPDATIAALHAQGRKVICYFSAGSSENWRSDFRKFAASDMGKPLDGWAGERWIDIRSENVRKIMKQRLKLAASRGCHGVEPDNVDGYANRNGLGLTAEDQLSYNRFLATEAHRRGLAIGLKNDLDQVPALVGSFDFAVNEQCHQYRECEALRPFVAAGKPVFNAEYQGKYRNNIDGARDRMCQVSRAENFRTLVLSLKLDGKERFSCD